MHRLRKIMAIILLLTLLPTCFSCVAAEEGGFLRRLDAPAELTVSGQRYGVEFSAAISLGEGEGTMTFLAPASLGGRSMELLPRRPEPCGNISRASRRTACDIHRDRRGALGGEAYRR